MGKDSFGARTTLAVGDKSYTIYALAALQRKGFDLTRLPFSIKVMLETSSAAKMANSSPPTTSKRWLNGTAAKVPSASSHSCLPVYCSRTLPEYR